MTNRDTGKVPHSPAPDPAVAFGGRLREARLAKGLTQEQLAEAIGVAKPTLSGYERGIREPDFLKLNALLEVLEVDADYLLTGRDTKKASESTTIDSEDQQQTRKIYDLLRTLFAQSGYLGKDGDLSEKDLRFFMGLAGIMEAYFTAKARELEHD